MIYLSAAMTNALRMRTTSAPSSINREPAIVYEIYSPDYVPPSTGFDPADALQLFSETSITWLGHTYRRQVQSRGDIVRLVTSEFNRVDLNFDNSDLFMSTYVIANEVEGQRLVARYLDRALSTSLADSVILFPGRMERASSIDESECSITSMSDLASIDYDIPQRTFSPIDPKGRKPGDILYEGFQFNAVAGFRAAGSIVTKRYLFFFTKKKVETHTEQWSAESGTSRDQVVPLVFGRCQMEGIPVLWADVGFFIDGLWVFAGHKVSAIEGLKTQTAGYGEITGATGPAPRTIGVPPRIHLGDVGGTGTNATVDAQFPTSGAYLSRTAYVGGGIFGPEAGTASFPNPGQDQIPVLTAIVKGEAGIPDSIGSFTARGFTDNPAYITRFILTDPDLMNLDASLIDDEECIRTAAYCDEFVQDDTNAELVVMSTDDATQLTSGTFERYHSSGLYNSSYYNHYLDPITYDDPLTTPLDDPTIYDIPTLPSSLAPVTQYRKRYTFNAPLTDKVKAVDFLFKTVLPSFRGYLLTGVDGRIKILTERPADSTFVRSASSVGATSLAVNDITTWLDMIRTIRRIYRSALNRAPTGAEQSSALAAIQTPTGISVTAAAALIKSIFLGAEYLAFGHTDTQFVADIYSAYMNRLGDTAGSAFWLTQVGASSRSIVMDEFGSSVEFAARILSAGSASNGLALIGVGLVTSETRVVVGAEYSAAGNSITTTASASGITLTVGGATLSGGTTSVAPSGTYTVSGTPNAGDTITATIDGIPITYTLNAGDTLQSAAAMLAAAINASWKLKTYIRAAWNYSTGLTVYAKLGTLTLFNSSVLVTWTNLVNATSSGHDVTKTAGGSAYNAGGFSVEGITADGYIEVTGLNPAEERSIGVSTTDPDAAQASIDYSFVMFAGGTGQINENGVNPVGGITYDATTIFKIERTGTTIKYYVNVALVWTSLVASAGTLFVDTSIKTPTSVIPSVRLVQGGLTNAHNALLASPTAAPVPTAAASGALAAGTYYLAYSYTTAVGETFISPVASVAITAGQKVSVAAITPLPAGVADVRWYFSKAPDDQELAFIVRNNGATLVINTLPADDASLVPVANSAGEEIIKVQASFTQENIRLGKFRWPLTGQSSINQVKIKYREASEDFAERELNVNDAAHQRLIKKVNTAEIDGSGIDNYNQASRIANSRLSKEREGNFLCEWDTDEAGIVFEEGDVVCATDITGGFVNIPLRIESIRIHDDLDVTFLGRLYSTIMYSDATGQHPVTLPSTLKYVNQPPPVATNLVLTQVNVFTPTLQLGIAGTFDFGAFAAGQVARVYIKGPGISEPPDSDYRQVESVPVQPINTGESEQGQFQIVGLEIGHYWIKVETESVYGYKASSGHPEADIEITPQLDAPTGVEIYKDSFTSGSAASQQLQVMIPTRDALLGEQVKYWTDIYPSSVTANFTANATTNELTSAAHGLTTSHTIALSNSGGALPVPLDKTLHYYLRDITTNTFKLALTPGGAAVDLTNTGSGTHSFTIRVRHMPVFNIGTANPAILSVHDSSPTPTWRHTITAGSGGWAQTIDSDYFGRNDADPDFTASSNLGGDASFHGAVLAQLTESGAWFEFTLGSATIVPLTDTEISLGDTPFGDPFTDDIYRMVFEVKDDSGIPGSKSGAVRWQLKIYERIAVGATSTLVYTDPDYEIPGMSYRMMITGSEMQYYRDYGGPNRKLLYRSELPAILPLRPLFIVAGDHVMERLRFGGLKACVTTYPDSDQMADQGLGSPPTTLRYRVYEERLYSGIAYLSPATDFTT